MDLKLQEKIILVTCGSKGIGTAISHVLAADGAIPFIVSRDEKSILQTKEEIEKNEQQNFMLNAIYHIASAMIYADGKIEKEEVQVAETIGKQIMPNFNSSSFREYINSEPKSDLFEKLISYFNFI